MHVVVTVKQIPDPAEPGALDPDNTLKRDGTPILGFTSSDGEFHPSAKANLWKCPYHNSRACLELIERVDELTKTDTARE